MSIRYQCVKCDAVMKIKEDKAGTKGHCPQCKAEFIVPGKSPDKAEVTDGAEEAEKVEASVATAVAESDSAAEEETIAAKPASNKSSKPKKPSSAEMDEADLEDELQQVLMGGGDDDDDAPRTRRPPADSDTFLTDDLGEDEPSGRSESPAPSSGEIEKPKPPSTAEISAAMMRKKGNKSDSDTGVKNKKTGRAFGEVNDETTSRRKRADVENRKQLIQQGAAIAGGLVLIIAIIWWAMQPGKGNLPPLNRVTGKVTYKGSPLAGATVKFQPMQEAGSITSGKAKEQESGSMGITDKDGNYELYYVMNAAGAVAGKHMVQIEAQNDVGLQFIPDKYNFNSQLMYEVKSGSNRDVNFDLTE